MLQPGGGARAVQYVAWPARESAEALEPRRSVGREWLAEVAAKQVAAHAGQHEAAAQARHRDVTPWQKRHAAPAQVPPRAHESAQKSAVRDEPATAHREHVNQIMKLSQVG